jgi:hypothetical protein
MAKQLYFTHPLENLLSQAESVTITTGTALAGYGATRLFDGVWHTALKIAGTDLDVDMVFADPVSPALSILAHSNVTVAAQLLGHTDSSFGSGSPDVALAFGVPVAQPDGFFSSPWIVPDPAPAAKTNWRLRIQSNGYPICIGEFGMWAQARGLEKTYLLRSQVPGHQGSTVVHQTDGLIELAYEKAAAIRTIEGLLQVRGDEHVALRNLVAAARYRARPFFLIPRASVDDAWMVRFAVDVFTEPPLDQEWVEVFAPVRMCGRGLPWVDPDEV